MKLNSDISNNKKQVAISNEYCW